MHNFRLSVCIATLNRADLLRATLKSIICQATIDVEIIVLDGASTDDTEEVVRRCQESFPRLRYFRQETNMGVDHDFAEAVRLAEGDYCWLFSDDDLLKPGAIQTVLDATKGEYALIIANSEVRNADLSKVLQLQRLPLSEDRIYEPNENHRLLAETGNYVTFIGSVIINRELWQAREKEKYFGSFFVHVGVIFQSPLPGDALVIANPLISMRYGNASWLEKYFEISMFKWPNLIWSFERYTDAVKLQVCPKEPWRKLRTLLLLRAKGCYTRNTYLQWLSPRLRTTWSRAASKAITYLPGGVLNFLAVLYYSTLGREHDQPLVLGDLVNSPYYVERLVKRRSVFGEGRSGKEPVAGMSPQRPVIPGAFPSLPLGRKDDRIT
jgi:abequosyltransferase